MNIDEAIEYATNNLSLIVEKEGTDKLLVDGDTMMTHAELIEHVKKTKERQLDVYEDFDEFEKDIKSLPEQVFKQLDTGGDVDIHVLITVNNKVYKMYISADVYSALENLLETIKEDM